MSTHLRKLLVLTSGGDAPGMNAAIRAVVRAGVFHGLEVWGCRRGFQGLVDRDLVPMGPETVANIIQRGGTVLKTARCQAFLEKTTRDRCREFLKDAEIDGLIAIGGDGTFRGAAALENEGGPKTIGIPGTIDNDVAGSEYTIGFDTARNTALEAIDKIRDTASSHDRNFLVEVMGHETGFLAMDVGISGGAELIITPEFDTPISEIAKRLKAPRRSKLSSIIVVAEGDAPNRSIQMAEELKKLTQREYRVCILGHTQRGGTPTAMDRKVASCMGALAVRALSEGQSKKMTAMQNHDVVLSPFAAADKAKRKLSDKRLVELTEILAT
jgi:6-phosphofructokinase 1